MRGLPSVPQQTAKKLRHYENLWGPVALSPDGKLALSAVDFRLLPGDSFLDVKDFVYGWAVKTYRL